MEEPSMTAAVRTEKATPDISVRFWGTRGSIASPGPQTARYGGNTSCIEVTVGSGRRLVFDAGTGIRQLGQVMVAEEGACEAVIFLTHFHWDHIQGFPFFVPLYRPDASLRIIGPKQFDVDVQTLFAGQMGPIYFPIPFEAFSAKKTFSHLNEGTWEEGGIRVSAMRVNHPSFCVGYRIDFGDASLAYVPDNELFGQDYGLGDNWRRDFVDFIGDVDVLIHDAMYTEDEYPSKVGWGHSTYRQDLDLADEAGVEKLLFFHHDPTREDAQLTEIVNRARDAAASEGKTFEIEAASEGSNIPM
jgi:phosphoribosyl 1,2-cyclic phosphodiesterase